MIKLYKNAEKNEKIKAVIADLRKTSRPFLLMCDKEVIEV